MKKLIFSTIEKFIEGVDTYNNNGSVWLIFTDERKWVIELTKEGTLWYNYYFFQDIFKYFSLDVVENQRYITEWVELFIQNGVKHTDWCQIGTSTSIEDAIQNGVKLTLHETIPDSFLIEDTIQNGVKETVPQFLAERVPIEDTIQNGVKETKHNLWDGGLAMEEAIQNGVKETFLVEGTRIGIVENTIQNGVKRTELGGKDRKIDEIKDIVENGIKETNLEEHHRLREVVQTVKNGIKETTPGGYLGSVEMKGKTVHQFEHSKQDNDVENVIESGIKATESIASHRAWMSEQVINNGIKETVCGVLQKYNLMNFEPVTKEMKRMNEVNIVLEKGIKETNWRKVDNHPTFVDVIVEKSI